MTEFNKAIPIIDLFAGPGGLGEGFTSIVDNNNNRSFKIALSIECDEYAHQTLTLRSFLRQFPPRKFPKEYYQFLQSEIRNIDDLFKLFPKEASNAINEAWKFRLGEPHNHDLIDSRISSSLKGEKNFVLIGGPPCQAYSLVGRARRKQKNGLSKEDERVYLYREYYRILAVHRPPVFVMENVKGLLSSKVENENIFAQIINDLNDPIEAYKKLRGQEKIYKSRINYNIYSLVRTPRITHDIFGERPLYEPKDFIIKAEDYGIPQSRHRVILLGIRNDLQVIPGLIKPFGKLIPIEKVINGLPQLRSGLSKSADGKTEWRQAIDGIKKSSVRNEIESQVWQKIIETIDRLASPRSDRGADFIHIKSSIDYNPRWYIDKKIEGTINHETRSHLKEDLHRYIFASCFAKVYGRSPKLSEFPMSLLPNHENVHSGDSALKFADRFRTQVYGQPSKTVTSHISKDGHYFIHPDPRQCRSLTVREAARIQTFPDNYFFCGPRTEQYHQVGNAVPPLLAKQIAEVVRNVISESNLI